MRPGALIAAVASLVIAAVIVAALGRSSGDAVVVEKPKIEEGMPQPASEGPQPKMVVDQSVHNFGMLQLDSEGKHEFIIKNEGEAPLEFKIGKRTCQCTGAVPEAGSIPPGGSSKITLNWHIRNPNIRFEHSAQLHTNDPKQTQVSLVIKGIVGQKLRTFPPGDWTAGTTSKENPGTVEGYVMSNMLDDFKVVGHEGSSSALKVTILPVTPEERRQLITHLRGELETMKSAETSQEDDSAMWLRGVYKVAVEVATEGKAGSYSEPLRLQTDVPDDKELNVNITGTRPPPFAFIAPTNAKVVPKDSILVLTDFEAAKGKTFSVIIIPVGMSEDLELGEPVCEPSQFKASFSRPMMNGKQVKLTVEIPAGLPPMIKSQDDPATITFTTNHPQMKELTLKVVFTSL